MKKILLLLLFLVLGCSFKTIEPKSSLSDSKGFKFDNRFVNTVHEMDADDILDVKVHKNYFWGTNKGIYKVGEFTVWNAIYSYYNDLEDRQFFICCSWTLIQPNVGDYPGGYKRTINNLVTTKQVKHKINVNFNNISYSNGLYYPVNSNTKETVTTTLGTESSNDGPAVNFQVSSSYDYTQIINRTNVSNGIDVTYDYKNHWTSDEAIYTSASSLVSSYIFSIKSPSKYTNKFINVQFEYDCIFAIDDVGLENYDAVASSYPNYLKLQYERVIAL